MMLAEFSQLRQLLNKHFNLTELQDLCFFLNIDFQNLRGETKDEKIIALIYFLGRQKQLESLLTRCRESRPSATWPTLSLETQNILYHTALNAKPYDEVKKDQRNQLILLNKVRNFWIDGVLQDAIPLQEAIQLEWQQYDQAVVNPWRDVVGSDQYTAKIDPLPQTLFDIFMTAEKSLLILGKPGSGKTITIIQLARTLATLAELDTNQPIPVILNLSSWAEVQDSIADWVVAELNSKYQIPLRYGRNWLEEERLLFLLDGLDEVAEPAQANCITALNQFRRSYGLPGFVVSSRVEPYEKQKTRLEMGTAILIQPLIQSKISTYLATAGSDYQQLRQIIDQDDALQEMAQTPLMLTIMLQAFRSDQKTNPNPLKPIENPSLKNRQAQLLQTYVDYAEFHRGEKSIETYDKMKEQLAWLAQNMYKHNQTVFLVERIQPSWLPTQSWQWSYLFLTRMAVGLMVGLFSWLLALLSNIHLDGLELNVMQKVGHSLGIADVYKNPVAHLFLYAILGCFVALTDGVFFERRHNEAALSWKEGIKHSVTVCVVMMVLLGGVTMSYDSVALALFGGVVTGLFFVLVFGYFDHGQSFRNEIRTVDILSWSWAAAMRGTMLGCVLGLLVGGIIAFAFAPYWGGMFTLSIVVAFFFLGGIQSERVEAISYPNQGIWLTARNSLIVAMIASLVSGLLFSFLLSHALSGLLVSGAVFLAAWALFGGADLLKYLCVRGLLWVNGRISWHFIQVLDDASSRVLLHKVGGGYLFMHRSLQAYFYNLSDEPH